jgi:hypothetical protein
MSSPRYLAEHMIMPRFLRETGFGNALAAIQRRDADYFIPVWMKAGFRFSPTLLFTERGDWRVGVLTLPQPREITEAYLAAIVGRISDPTHGRYFLLETAESIADKRKHTVLGEWNETRHGNFGEGPPFTGNLPSDQAAFVDRVLDVCTRA